VWQRVPFKRRVQRDEGGVFASVRVHLVVKYKIGLAWGVSGQVQGGNEIDLPSLGCEGGQK